MVWLDDAFSPTDSRNDLRGKRGTSAGQFYSWATTNMNLHSVLSKHQHCLPEPDSPLVLAFCPSQSLSSFVVVLAHLAYSLQLILLITQSSADQEPQSIHDNNTMASLAERNPPRISPKRKREESDFPCPQFAPQLNVTSHDPVVVREAGEDSPRSAIARQLQDFRIRGGVPKIHFGESADVPSLKRFKPTYDVQRQPRVRHTAVFRRRPSNTNLPERQRRSSSAPPPSERVDGLHVTLSTLAKEHHRPLNESLILSPLSEHQSPQRSPPTASPFLIPSLAKSATTSPVPSPQGLMMPPTPSIATSTIQPTDRSPPPRRPAPITISPSPFTITVTETPTSHPSKNVSGVTAESPLFSKASTSTTSSTHQSYSHLPVPFSPTSPLSPTALTWKPAEITGHLISHTLDTPDDDGYGINGIGFKPSPQLALARQMRRRQQVMEWRAREAREARMARWRKRDTGAGVEGVSEVGGGGMKRVVRFA